MAKDVNSDCSPTRCTNKVSVFNEVGRCMQFGSFSITPLILSTSHQPHLQREEELEKPHKLENSLYYNIFLESDCETAVQRPVTELQPPKEMTTIPSQLCFALRFDCVI